VIDLQTVGEICGVEIDWQATYFAFREKHGNDPVLYAKRLLFRDGWMHSATDYQGPEFRPPKDPKRLLFLKRKYWQLRLAVVSEELWELRRRVRSLRSLQEARDGPLQQTSQHWDGDESKMVRTIEGLDLSPLEGRIKWLEDDTEEYTRQMRSLTEENNDA